MPRYRRTKKRRSRTSRHGRRSGSSRKSTRSRARYGRVSRTRRPTTYRARNTRRTVVRNNMFRPGAPFAGATSVVFKLKKFPMTRGLKALSGVCTYSTNGTVRFLHPGGQQSISLIPYGNQGATSWENYSIFNRNTYARMKEILDSQYDGDSNLTTKILYDFTRTNYTVKNEGAVTLHAVLYLCRPRWNVSVSEASFAKRTPNDAWSTGLIEADAPGVDVGTTGAGFLGVTPFQSPLFTSNWRIVGVRKFTLSPGGTHTTQIVQRGPRLLNGQTMFSHGSYASLSVFPMLVTHADPVSIDTETGLLATAGQQSVILMQDTKHQFRLFGKNMTFYARDSTMAPAPVGGVQTYFTRQPVDAPLVTDII